MSRYSVPLTERQRLRDAWWAADYRVRLGRRCLQLQPGQPARAIERLWPGASYTWVTGCNPPPGVTSPRANQAALRALRRDISAQGWSCRPGEASDGHGQWCEPGWLIRNLRLSQARALAQRYRQGGVLFWRRRQAVGLQLLWPPLDGEDLH